MWIEHTVNDCEVLVKRCPECETLTTERAREETPYTCFGDSTLGDYFICKNPQCKVDRIYDSGCIIYLRNDKRD